MASQVLRIGADTLCLLFFLYNVFNRSNGYCYTTDDNPYRFYAVRTKYDTIWNRKMTSHLNTSHVEGCEPSVFYLLARHGSRYTSAEIIKLMTQRLPEFQKIIASSGSLCEEDLAALRSWQMQMEEINDMDMAETGWQELQDIAMRYSQSFPELLAVPYNASWFQFQHTQKERTRDSARAFAEGLFGTYDGIEIEEIKQSEDWLIYFYKNCERYIAGLTNKYKEYKAFRSGPEIAGVIQAIQNRTGLLMDGDTEETDVNLQILFDACTFEYQVYNDSPWCSVFTKEDLEVIEYGEDVKYYWVDGYGESINYEQTCNLMKDIVYYLRLDEAQDANPPTFKVLTRFAHSGALNMLFAQLGLFKDDQDLTASTYREQSDRKWRTSYQNPMSGNIVFVRYTCSPETEDMVAVYVNEELVTLPVPGCTNGICPVSSLSREWLPTTSTCNVHEICDLKPGGSGQPQRLASLAVMMISTLLASLFWF